MASSIEYQSELGIDNSNDCSYNPIEPDDGAEAEAESKLIVQSPVASPIQPTASVVASTPTSTIAPINCSTPSTAPSIKLPPGSHVTGRSIRRQRQRLLVDYDEKQSPAIEPEQSIVNYNIESIEQLDLNVNDNNSDNINVSIAQSDNSIQSIPVISAPGGPAVSISVAVESPSPAVAASIDSISDSIIDLTIDSGSDSDSDSIFEPVDPDSTAVIDNQSDTDTDTDTDTEPEPEPDHDHDLDPDAELQSQPESQAESESVLLGSVPVAIDNPNESVQSIDIVQGPAVPAEVDVVEPELIDLTVPEPESAIIPIPASVSIPVLPSEPISVSVSSPVAAEISIYSLSSLESVDDLTVDSQPIPESGSVSIYDFQSESESDSDSECEWIPSPIKSNNTKPKQPITIIQSKPIQKQINNTIIESPLTGIQSTGRPKRAAALVKVKYNESTASSESESESESAIELDNSTENLNDSNSSENKSDVESGSERESEPESESESESEFASESDDEWKSADDDSVSDYSDCSDEEYYSDSNSDSDSASSSKPAKSKPVVVSVPVKLTARNRNKISADLYKEYNKRIFNNQLPETMKMNWTNRLKTTAGRCWFRRDKVNPQLRTADVELSIKILTDSIRLESVLIHELCHAAQWLIDNTPKPPHGSVFKKWGKIATNKYPQYPVARCHNHSIHKPYQYQCIRCGYKDGRHSESIKIDSHQCRRCGSIGSYKYLGKFNNDGTPVVQRSTPITGFAAYVKQNYQLIKQSTPAATPHTTIMKLLASDYKSAKQSNTAAKSVSNNTIIESNTETDDIELINHDINSLRI